VRNRQESSFQSDDHPRESGASVIEVSIGAALATVVFGGLAALVSTAGRVHTESLHGSTNNEQLRRSIAALRSDIQASGLGEVDIEVLPDGSTQITLASVIGRDNGVPVWGARPVPVGRLADRDLLMRDAAAVQRLSVASLDAVRGELAGVVSRVIGSEMLVAQAGELLTFSPAQAPQGHAPLPREPRVVRGLLRSQVKARGGIDPIAEGAAADGTTTFDVASADVVQVLAKLAANGFQVLSTLDWTTKSGAEYTAFVVAPAALEYASLDPLDPSEAASPPSLGGTLAGAVGTATGVAAGAATMASEAVVSALEAAESSIAGLLDAAGRLVPRRIQGVPRWTVRYTVFRTPAGNELHRQLIDSSRRLIRSEMILDKLPDAGFRVRRRGIGFEIVFQPREGTSSVRQLTVAVIPKNR